MANDNHEVIDRLGEQVASMDLVRCNLEVVALGMKEDTMGSDLGAVEACAEMLEVIHDRMRKILDEFWDADKASVKGD